MTKSLGSLLSRAEGRLAPILRLHVHASTQQMAQGDLVPVLHRADKKKRDIVKHLLQVSIHVPCVLLLCSPKVCRSMYSCRLNIPRPVQLSLTAIVAIANRYR